MSTLSLSGKVALITGGSKGIGKAMSLKFAALGAKVVVNYSGDESAALSVVKEIGEDNAIAIKANIGVVVEINRLVDETIAKYGKLDIVVANAAVMKMTELDKVTEAEFDNTFAVNVKGPFFLAQKAAPIMPKGSRFILFSTTLCVASTVTADYVAYVSSKGAIEQMTRLLSKDLARKGIMVNAIAPGPTATDLFVKGKSEQLLKTIAGFSPQGRIGQPEEIAGVAAFLAGPEGSWVTGQVIRVNGGMA